MLTTKDTILLEELIEKYGRDAVYEEIMNSRLKRKLGVLGITGALALGGHGLYKSSLNTDNTPEQQELKKEVSIEDIIPYYQEKVNAVDSYIKAAFARKGTPDKAENLGITPEEIVQITWEEDFDIGLALAAAWIETHFGTEGVCAKKNTNSMYSVGAWDNGTIHSTYETKADALRAYARLVKTNFMRGRDIDTLLQNGNFVNGLNKRYASDTKYESKLRNTRANILKAYPVLRPDYDLTSDLTAENI